MEKIMNKASVLEHLINLSEDNTCDHSDCFEWREWRQTDNFISIGTVSDGSSGEFDSTLQYWGKDAPIVLHKYPYYGCAILKCAKCDRLFLKYRETGGHASEERIRLLRKELIK